MNGRLLFSVVGLLAVGAGAARAQLPPADIEALRRQGEAEGWTFTVRESEATQYPLDELCGLVEPPDWRDKGVFDPCLERGSLPVAFSWLDLNGCTPIRDQLGCGSCWAFATVGPLECDILLNDGAATDLSEQWLLSCNQEGFDCGGGWFAHDYHRTGGATDPCGGNGAVSETDFPYVAQKVPCSCPYPHHYWINGWAYIGGGSGVPPVNSIKQAIVDHGPVSVALCANTAFHGYGGGVFNACTYPKPCNPNTGDPVNHAVTLVGWDDNQGANGVWILRNSWGPTWGENGYMRIEYGCLEIGYAACYINYPGNHFTIWVDFAATGTQTGSFSQPYHHLSAGVAAVAPGGFVRIKAGSSPETIVITKPLTLASWGGTVTIGQ
jgi:C1A family cysteine protease